MLFTDADAFTSNQSTASNANVNFFKSTTGDTINLGGGRNRVNAATNLTSSSIYALDGSDTVRIGGKADNTNLSLGAGNDQLTIGLSSSAVNAYLGEGQDNALFQGKLIASPLPTQLSSSFNGSSGPSVIDMGADNDRATFLGGVSGGQVGYQVDLGYGNDTAIFGGNSISDGFTLDTGSGADSVLLGRNTTHAYLFLGWEADPTNNLLGDTVVLGAGASISDSTISSRQSSDLISLAGTINNTDLLLGDSGGATVNVSGTASFISDSTTIAGSPQNSPNVWDFGNGDDNLIFSSQSSLLGSGDQVGYVTLGLGADRLELNGVGFSDPGGVTFDLGSDQDADTLVFASNTYSGITISNFGTEDILYIGKGMYGYGYQLLNNEANLYDLGNFQASNNVIWAQQPDSGLQDVMTLDSALVNSEVEDPIVTSMLADKSQWSTYESNLPSNNHFYSRST